MKVMLRFALVGLLAVLLIGCAKKPVKVCSPAGLKKLTATIEKQAGGQYVELGDQVLVDIPSWYLFVGNSSDLSKQGRQLIGKITQRMACYKTKAISVSAYTGVLPSSSENKALGAQRAKTVTDSLLYNGVTRLIYQHSFAINNKCRFCRLNRIEIVTNQLH